MNTNNENKLNIKKINKIFLYILAIILFAFSIFLMADTYSKYVSSAEVKTHAQIAKWSIKVNNIDITRGTNIIQTIVPILPGTKHINPGVLAPTAKGYFDISIDASDVDVSFDYTIDISQNTNNPVLDLHVTDYSVDDGEKISVTNENNQIKERINLNDPNRTKNLRVFFSWLDNHTDEKTNNFEDAAIAKNPDNKGMLDIKLNFIQVK